MNQPRAAGAMRLVRRLHNTQRQALLLAVEVEGNAGGFAAAEQVLIDGLGHLVIPHLLLIARLDILNAIGTRQFLLELGAAAFKLLGKGFCFGARLVELSLELAIGLAAPKRGVEFAAVQAFSAHALDALLFFR